MVGVILFPFFRFAGTTCASVTLCVFALAFCPSSFFALAISRGEGMLDRVFPRSVRREYGCTTGQTTTGLVLPSLKCFFPSAVAGGEIKGDLLPPEADFEARHRLTMGRRRGVSEMTGWSGSSARGGHFRRFEVGTEDEVALPEERGEGSATRAETSAESAGVVRAGWVSVEVCVEYVKYSGAGRGLSVTIRGLEAITLLATPRLGEGEMGVTGLDEERGRGEVWKVIATGGIAVGSDRVGRTRHLGWKIELGLREGETGKELVSTRYKLWIGRLVELVTRKMYSTSTTHPENRNLEQELEQNPPAPAPRFPESAQRSRDTWKLVIGHHLRHRKECGGLIAEIVSVQSPTQCWNEIEKLPKT